MFAMRMCMFPFCKEAAGDGSLLLASIHPKGVGFAGKLKHFDLYRRYT